jgi:hypothetical protein
MSIRGIAFLCIALALVGWFALGSFTYHSPPDGLNRVIAMAILWATLLVTLLLPAYFVNLRLGSDNEVVLRAARQSALAALFLVLCVWLRMSQALNWARVILMAILFLLTEVSLAATEA